MSRLAFVCRSVAVLVAASLTASAFADGKAVSQLRRTIEDSERSASGDVRLDQKGSKQKFDTLVKNLAEQSFRVYVTTNMDVGFSTNDFVFFVAALERTNVKKGTWQRKLQGSGGAPPEVPFVDDLEDLAGRQAVIARPGPDITVEITNLFNCVTNNINGSNQVDCTTNIITGVPLFDPGVTGFVSAVLWAPLPPLLTKPGAPNYTRKVDMDLPDGVPISPDAKGRITTKFKNSKGQSVLDVRAKGLIRGQEYSVWIGDAVVPTVLIKAGDMELKGDGKSARFTRDTKYGDPLPQQVQWLEDLTGRPLVILDAFEDVHLEGIIP